MVAIDVSRDSRMDLHNPDLWGYLCFLMRTCKVIGIIGGPPCRTVSRLRLIQPGPPVLRSRTGEGRFGLEGLSPQDQLKTDGDSALVLKQLALRKMASEMRGEDEPEVGFLMESPRDPVEYGDNPEAPSFWEWPELKELLEDPRMNLLTFDQGHLGHPQVKPTSCLTNLRWLFQLQGMKSSWNHGEPLKSDLDERCKQTSSWSSWAPGLKRVIRASLLHLLREHEIDDGSCRSLMKLLNREQWFRHFQQGHRPFRRDCRTCLLDMGSGKPHRRREAGGSSAWSMGVDIVQFPKTVDETTGENVRYAMVATLLVPVFGEREEEGFGESSRDETPKEVERVEDWGEGLDEEEFSLAPPEIEVAELEEGEVEPVDEDTPKSEVSPVVSPREEELERCKEPVKVKHVTVSIPMGSRAVSEVLHSLNYVTTQFKSMGLYVDRVHSDKARELVARPVRQWAAARGITQTTTGGDDPAAAGHVESEVQQLKRRMRFYLRQAALGHDAWPLALRYSVEERRRGQLEVLGTPTLPMIPFYSQVVVKRKRWHDRGHLAPPFVSGTLLSPSPLMHHGWTVRTDEGLVVHVREAVVPSSVGESVALELRESDKGSPVELVEVEKPLVPPHRLIGKQPMPYLPENYRVVFPESSSNGPDSSPARVAGGEIGKGRDPEGEGGPEPDSDVISHFDSDLEDDESRRVGFRGFKREGSKRETKRKKTEGLKFVGEGTSVESVRMDPQRCSFGDGRKVDKGWLEEVWLREHETVSGALEEAMNHVPVGPEDGSASGEEIDWLTNTRSELEGLLREVVDCEKSQGLKVRALSTDHQGSGEDEVLQTVVVSLDEVRNNLEGWKQAMMNEYRSLTEETHAIEPIDVHDLDDQQTELVPGKLVCTLKAGPNGGKRKCRAVICGNLLDDEKDPCPSSYASGADGLLIRASVKHGVEQGWGISTTDVKTAFLLAPRPRVEGTREVVVIPPKILMQAGVCKPSERWRVHRALYGFPSSPARWSLHRDSVFKTFQWSQDGTDFALRRTPEGNLWKIMELKEPTGSSDVDQVSDRMEVCVGHVLVYVDDVMIIAPELVRKGFLERLKREWTVSEPETVSETGWVRFCGLEFRWENPHRLHLAQPSYTHDLLDRHQVEETRSSPIPKLDVPIDPEEGLTGEDVKRAQTLTGELLWLSVRSRPDVSFAVSLMSRHLSKNPRWVVRVGRYVLEYLASTPNQGLVYEPCQRDRGPDGTLPIVRHEGLIEAYADISFAPQGSRSCQGIVVFYGGSVVQWEATRQPFCALSTAEAELLGYCETMQLVQALESLLTVLHGHDQFEKLLVGDNSSAISILTKPDGPWRTRHLRLRSNALKEKLADSKGDWKLRHQKGTELIADFLTKPITALGEWKRFARFMSMGTLVDETKEGLRDPTCDSKAVNREWDATSKDPITKVARLGVAMAALGRVANSTGGRTRARCRVVLAKMALTMGVQVYDLTKDVDWVVQNGHCFLSPLGGAGTQIDECSAVGLQEKKAKTKSHQESQEVREYEPTQGFQWNEKGQSEGLRVMNEPNPCRSILKSSNCAVEWSQKNLEAVARRVKWSTSVTLVGADDGLISYGSLNDCAGSSVPVSFHHCPSGCPGLCRGVGSNPTVCRAMADQQSPSGVVKLAAVSVKRESLVVERPWEMEKFYKAPSSSKDSWIDTMMDRGWLLRAHGGARVRKFHPVHRGTPVGVELLEGERVSIGFDDFGGRTVAYDRWTDPPGNLYDPKKIWRGWTFLKLKVPVKPSLGGLFVEGAGLPIAGSLVVGGGAHGDVHQDCEAGGYVATGSSTDGGLGVGYAGGTALDRGRIVCRQLPMNVTMSSSVNPLNQDELLSDEESWEKIPEVD